MFARFRRLSRVQKALIAASATAGAAALYYVSTRYLESIQGAELAADAAVCTRARIIDWTHPIYAFVFRGPAVDT